LVFADSTHVALADGTTPSLAGRMTVTIVDANAVPIPFEPVAMFGITARNAAYAAEIKTTGFVVTALEEVQDPTTAVYTPALDYYDAAKTPPPTTDAGGNSFSSIDGAFYDK
jgi:hypothetical protein